MVTYLAPKLHCNASMIIPSAADILEFSKLFLIVSMEDLSKTFSFPEDLKWILDN